MRRIYLFKVVMLIMAVSALAVFNSSCEKENLEDLKQTSCIKKPRVVSDDEIMKDLPEVKDGRLVFKDSVSFANYYLWLIDNQDNQDKVNKINASLGFVCMHEIYDKGLDALCESESITCPYIEEHPTVFHIEEIDSTIFHNMQAPDIVGYIANELGLYQVGNNIYRSTHDYTYCITNGDENKIQLLLNLNGEKTGDSIILSYPTFYKSNGTKGQYGYRTAYFDPNTKTLRAVARLSSGIVSQTGVNFYEFETSTQRKLGAWIGVKFNGVWVKWGNGSYFFIGNGGQQHTETITAGITGSSNKQKTSRTFASYTNSTIIPSQSYVNTVHKAYHEDWDTVRIYYDNAFTAE